MTRLTNYLDYDPNPTCRVVGRDFVYFAGIELARASYGEEEVESYIERIEPERVYRVYYLTEDE